VDTIIIYGYSKLKLKIKSPKSERKIVERDKIEIPNRHHNVKVAGLSLCYRPKPYSKSETMPYGRESE